MSTGVYNQDIMSHFLFSTEDQQMERVNVFPPLFVPPIEIPAAAVYPNPPHAHPSPPTPVGSAVFGSAVYPGEKSTHSERYPARPGISPGGAGDWRVPKCPRGGRGGGAGELG